MRCLDYKTEHQYSELNFDLFIITVSEDYGDTVIRYETHHQILLHYEQCNHPGRATSFPCYPTPPNPPRELRSHSAHAQAKSQEPEA